MNWSSSATANTRPQGIDEYRDLAVRLPGSSIGFGRTPVTNALFADVLNRAGVENLVHGTYRFFNPFNPDLPLSYQDGVYVVRPGFEEHPVTGVSWFGAQEFANLVGGRLPTSTEWRSAAGNAMYPWGDEYPTDSLANFDEHVGRTTPVGDYPPNELGLYDLAGNVGEWCSAAGEVGVPHGEFPVKGGGWNKPAQHLRSDHVRYKWGRIGTVGIGFRVVFPYSPEES